MFTDPAGRYFDLIKRMDSGEGPQLDMIRKLFNKFDDLADSMGYCDLNLSLPSLLTMNDRAAAAFGLENRCPFLDHRIVEFAFRLPTEMKIREFTTKYILRKAARGIVPDAIIDRKDKKGLVVPINLWFKTELAPWARGLLKSLDSRIALPAGGDRGEFDRSSYSRVSLEMWFRNFFPGYGR